MSLPILIKIFIQQLNTDLKPQSSINYQVGLRNKFSDRFKGSLSLFRMNVKNELYYNATPNNGVPENENYDRTVHEGLESCLEAKVNNRITLFGNYTFTDAYFDGGQYSGNKIPLVPQNKGSVGLRLFLPKNFTFNMVGTYTGKSYAMDDQANAYSQVGGYMVTDTNLSWHYKDLAVTFGINNIFNRQYSEFTGVNVYDGLKFYYPNPKRNFSLKAKYTF